MINKAKYFFLMVLCAGLFGASLNIAAQTNTGSVSAKINKVVEFYEWAFETKFTASERQQYKNLKTELFQNDNATESKEIDGILANYAAVQAKNENEQFRVRQAFLDDFIKSLRGQTDNEEAKFLLSVYDRAQAESEAETNSAGNGDISGLVGKWVWAHSGSSTISTAGAYMGSNGSRFTYQFAPDGTVEFTGIMNIMQGGCNQQVFRSAKGKASLIGNTLTVRWQPAKFTRDFSCDTANNYTKTEPAKVEKFKVAFKTDYGQKQLCFVGAECYSETK